MKRDRAKLANDSVRTFHYNTRSSSCRHGISNTDDRVRSNDSIVESTSPRVRRRQRKKISDDRSTTNNSDLLPIDLLMEILKRLPVKTLTRFLSVSKLWASIIRGRDLMKLFLAESSSRPGRLFFTFLRGDECFTFSSLQSQNPGEASYLFTHPGCNYSFNLSSVHGLICYGTASACELVVYHSSTRRSITLPELNSQSLVMKQFLCYDPIGGVYKVLCLTVPRLILQEKKPVDVEHVLLVLTLGNGSSWKVIEDPYDHFPIFNHICINGVLYYDATTDSEEALVMSFDVRSEKFDLIKGPGDPDCLLGCISSTMTRYEGKLAIC